MRRREFISLLSGAAVAWPVAADAQQAAKIARIGYLSTDLASSGLHDAFRQGLRDLGYVEGRNVVIEYRDAEEGRQSLSSVGCLTARNARR
jgi:putative tryptophan/tyrosine transport system substrate-binding protein